MEVLVFLSAVVGIAIIAAIVTIAVVVSSVSGAIAEEDAME